jgi:transposase InsO family protein
VSVSRPPVLAAGDEVCFRGEVRTVTRLAAGAAYLAGMEPAVKLADLFTDPDFAVVTAGGRAPLPPEGLLEGLPADVTEQARWWERHMAEVVSGLPADAGPNAVPRLEYDPAVTSLRQREIAKAAELRAAGRDVPLRTLQRLRRSYETEGVWGLVDHRFTRQSSVAGRVDERVVDAVRRAVTEETGRSTGTVDRLRRRVVQILAAEHGMTDPSSVMPSRATFYRLVARVSAGRHTFGSARTRRSLAERPDGPFGTVTSARPGEWMQIDSTPIDVRVVLDNGMIDRAELTWLIDYATRTIPAAVLRPSTKAVDAALLLARALTPEPMRPGWADALRMSRSVLPHRRLTAIDQRLEHAAARPVIVPETIVCDHGMVYMSQAFRSACRALGISFQPSHKGSPWEKGAVERSLGSAATLFAQHAAGYVGSSVERRGKNAERDAVWSITELQDLLDEWIVVWQNRPHDGLRHPLMPGRALTPNEQYAALVEAAGYVPVPLSAADYIELLPVTWRAVNAYGVKVSNRKYDCAALNPYRHQDSGVTARKGLWEVHYDPYDVTRIWVRNHHDGGWITVSWTQLKAAPVPFGEAAWDHARRLLARRGEDPATEQEIAQAAAALLDRAGHQTAGDGEPSKKDLRAAARARATAEPAWPRPAAQPPEPGGRASESEPGDDDRPAAKVIPLGIFDPFEEAGKPW